MDGEKNFKVNLNTVFNHDKYLNKEQKEAVINIYEGKRDIFIRGFGKSLPYQLAVLTKQNAFVVVITPRNAYTKKYTDYFTNKNIKTHFLNTNTSRKKKGLIEHDITSESSDLKILFITPLQYETAYCKNLLKQINKQRLMGIVIDQAENIISKHENLCNQYSNLDLKIIRVPIIAISATASLKVQEEIRDKFLLRNPKVFAMPIRRTNMYLDLRITNLIADPMADVINFIRNMSQSNTSRNSEKESGWGLIINKDLEKTTNIAKYLTSTEILTLAHTACTNKNARSKNTNLRNIEDVQIISVCEKNSLSITNSLVEIITKKPVKFVIYCGVVPSIERYYLLLSRTQSSNETSHCRIYYSIEELLDKYPAQYSCIDDNNYELQSAMFSSLIDMRCRHQVYSEFFGDAFSVCKKFCDVCKEKDEIQNQLAKLLEIADNPSLEKLQQILPEFSKTWISLGNDNSCLEHGVLSGKTRSNTNVRGGSVQMVSSNSIISIAELRQEQANVKCEIKRRDEKKKIVQKICNKTESIANLMDKFSDNNNSSVASQKTSKVERDKKKEAVLRIEKERFSPNDNFALDESSRINQKKRKVERDKTKEAVLRIENEIFSYNDNSGLDENSRISQKKSKVERDKPKEAVSRIEKESFSYNYNSTLDGASQSSQKNSEVEKDKKEKAIFNLNQIYKDLFGKQKSSENSIISEKKRVTPGKARNAIATDNKQYLKSNSNKGVVETKEIAVELITISDDESPEKENNFARTQTGHSTKIDKSDDEIIFVEEVRSSNKKRRRSVEQSLKNSEQSKRRKLR